MSFLRDAAVDLVVALKGLTLTKQAEAALHVLSNEIVRSAEVEEMRNKRKHSCPDWDYMVIDEDSPEFDACLCFKEENTIKEEVILPEGFEWSNPLYIKSGTNYLENVTDDALIGEVRRRGFTIRDAQISTNRWVGLTEADIYDAMDNEDEFDFAEAIEAKLKEKNT
jgi:hypothetical protein